MIKCPECNSCMKYRLFGNNSYYYCDFCDQYYWRIPGGGLQPVEEVQKVESHDSTDT